MTQPRPPTANDATLPLAKPATGDTASPADPTLHAPLTNSGAAPASEATLHPSDAKAQAFREAALRTAQAGPLGPGAAFGDYELIEVIAKGGMGVVYKARQRKLNRIVAIKMILAGQFADQTDVDRFYAEAEAAGALSHPNIVAIHEVGEVQGQHFFSMDFVEGQSLAALVQESPLPPRRAAELVRTIAETMQFAHDRHIVHRDLKPSNVLLDRKQRPLITDFGLAKQVTSQSQLTMSGAIIGTPSYMPPEQAAGKSEEVGPWSDIYSTGAVLYETLAGRPPFRAATPFETIRQVMEMEPLSPRLVNPNVPRDLETICLKCLQKERARRYATSQELADELGRFLRGEPIQARPISQVARFWRLCRRNPVVSSAIAASILMLIMTAVFTSVAYVRTSAALTQSEQSLREAMAAVNDLFTRVSEDTLLNQPGMQPLRKDLLQLALSYYQRFLQQRANDPRVQDELAAALFRIGLITEVLQSPAEALPSYEQARQMQVTLLALRPGDPARLEALGNTLNALGTVWVKKQDYAAARREYSEAVRIRTLLAGKDITHGEYQRVLANTYMNIGLAEFNAAQVAVGDEEFADRLADARKQFDEAQRIRVEALKSHPEEPKLTRDLGKGHFNLGNLDWTAQQNEHAAAHFLAAVTIFERLTKADPGDLENQKLLAICYRSLGDLAGGDSTARPWYQQALDRLEPLAQKNPDVVDYQYEQAGLWMSLSLVESQSGNREAARTALERARDILSPLADRYPAMPRYQRDLAVALRELAIEQDQAGQATAGANLQRAMQILAELVRKYPSEGEYAEQLKITQAVMLGSKSS